MLRATAVLRASWLLVATLAAVWACSAARLLRRDASEPNFADLPAEDKMALLSREVVLMHHKRLQELNNTLTRLARLEGAEQLHVTVVQTLGASEAAAADASAALLRALAPRLPFHLSHRPLVLAPSAADGTYSVDSSRYGTKRNSFRNLLHGLEGAFTAESHGQTAVSAAPQLGSCASSSGRAWRLWAVSALSGEETGQLSPQPPPPVLELAASKAADPTAFDRDPTAFDRDPTAFDRAGRAAAAERHRARGRRMSHRTRTPT